jgi:hypothetical protein
MSGNPVTILDEGLLAPGTIRLFGRPFEGLRLGDLGANPNSNHPLAQAVRSAEAANLPAGFARIYAFTYLGNYFKLPEPLVFLVFGEGIPVTAVTPVTPATPAIRPIGTVGVEFLGSDFSEGVLVWPCDQMDVAVRIDIRIGWMKDLLLAEEMGPDNNMTGGDAVRRADIVGNANVVGRDANLVGRDANLIGRSR